MEPREMPSEYQTNLELLFGLPIFAGLPIEAMKLFTFLCSRESFKPGEVIFHQHEIDPHAYFILEGRVRVILEGDLEAVVCEFGPGDFIGGLSLFWEARRLFTLRAESRVVCLMLSREKFQKILEQFPSAGSVIFQNIAKRIYYWEQGFLSQYACKFPICLTGLGVTLM
jgi:CRP-like cAMP-binding protein